MKRALRTIFIVAIITMIGATVGVAAEDGRFIVKSSETVLDTKTNLMWAAKDNGDNITWSDAKSYCENYRGGGYTDWRMPRGVELPGLYDENKSYMAEPSKHNVHLTELIKLSNSCPWSSELSRGSATYFDFRDGEWNWGYVNRKISSALPVRNAK